MIKERVLDITMNDKGQMYAMAKKRQVYVNYLQQNQHGSQMSTKERSQNIKMDQEKNGSIRFTSLIHCTTYSKTLFQGTV